MKTATTAWLLPLAILVAVACGGGNQTGGSTTQSKTPVTLTVGVIPIVDVAPIYVGVQQGFFKDQNLDVKLELAQGGAAIIPAVVSGQYQFGFSNVVSELLAADKGLKLKIVSQGVQATDNPDSDYSAVLVKQGSPIKDCKGLEGKTIAVNTLNNIGDVTIKATCEKQGANVSAYKFIEVGFPDMTAALQKGSIDAMWSPEPFVTQAKQAGAQPIAFNYVGTAKKLTIATYFASADYANGNKDVVKRFQAGIDKSLDYSNSHPDTVRQVVQGYAKVKPDIAQTMVLPSWSHDLNKPSIDQLAGLMQKFGLVSKKPDLNSLYLT
jgi:NitT/TauT family transport system substrate-binding protein